MIFSFDALLLTGLPGPILDVEHEDREYYVEKDRSYCPHDVDYEDKDSEALALAEAARE